MSRKRKKEERAKTQLKKPKTAPGRHLPKGTNETKTEFKVAKIVIPGQKGESVSSGPKTSKKVGLKDLLGKLGHFSQSVRSDGLQGLKELVGDPGVGQMICSNLAKIMSSLVPLCQDKEKKIRQETVGLLGSVLKEVNPAQLSPFHPLISAHLSCSLTNIDPRIQREGLTLLDSLLEHAPSFITTQYQAIVPNCLDQISNKTTSSKGPKVAANLSENLTAIQWRLNVLTRVNKILELATSKKEEGGKEGGLQERFREGAYYPLVEREQVWTSLTDITRDQQRSSLGDIIQLVVPLMIETWVEARADTKDKRAAISSDRCSLLLSIAGILDRLLALVARLEQAERERVLRLMREKQLPEIRLHLTSSLPYTSPSQAVPLCNALLCLVSLSLETVPSPNLLDTAVTAARARQVPLEVRLRLAARLVEEQLEESERERLVESLGEESEVRVWRLLGREAVTRPGEAVTSWLSSLPSLLLEVEGGQRLELLDIVLDIVKTCNRTLAVGLRERWEEIESSVSQEEEEVRVKTTLSFIEHHCHRVTAG